MNNEGKGNSLRPEDISSTNSGSKLETTKLPENVTNPAVPIATETRLAADAIEQPADADESPSLSVDHEPWTDEAASFVAAEQERQGRQRLALRMRILPCQ